MIFINFGTTGRKNQGNWEIHDFHEIWEKGDIGKSRPHIRSHTSAHIRSHTSSHLRSHRLGPTRPTGPTGCIGPNAHIQSHMHLRRRTRGIRDFHELQERCDIGQIRGKRDIPNLHEFQQNGTSGNSGDPGNPSLSWNSGRWDIEQIRWHTRSHIWAHRGRHGLWSILPWAHWAHWAH